MYVDLGITGAKRSSYAKANPRTLVAQIMEERPTAGIEEVQVEFRRRYRDHEEHEDFLTTIEDYFSANAYYSLLNKREDASREKSQPDHAARATARSNTEAVIKKTKEKLAKHIEEQAEILLMNLLLPNGKRLQEATGKMCKRSGGFFGEVGKIVGDRGIVGKALSEGKLQELWAKWKAKP